MDKYILCLRQYIAIAYELSFMKAFIWAVSSLLCIKFTLSVMNVQQHKEQQEKKACWNNKTPGKNTDNVICYYVHEHKLIVTQRPLLCKLIQEPKGESR
jgi:hypothetical protein